MACKFNIKIYLYEKKLVLVNRSGNIINILPRALKINMPIKQNNRIGYLEIFSILIA
jgi:hypothetical protein